jgi:hypothetical protein
MMENEVSQTLSDALGGDATAAAEMWRAIARGGASPIDTQLWAHFVAGQVVDKVIDADLDSANRRAEAALKAIGFYGRIDRDRQLRADLALFEGSEIAKLSRAEIAKTIQLVSNDLDGLTLENAIKKIDRVRKK